MFEDEEWVEIEDFPNYMVSNYGGVKNVNRPGTLRKIAINARGFPIVVLYGQDSKTRYLRQLNVLVATAFLPPPPLPDFGEQFEYNSIWHIDGDLTNCRADNLRWELRNRVLEWNDMNRGKSMYKHLFKVRNNETGEIYDNSYECAMAEGIIESVVIKFCEQWPHSDKYPSRYSHIIDE